MVRVLDTSATAAGDTPRDGANTSTASRRLQGDEPAAELDAGGEPAFIIKRKMHHTATFDCPGPNELNGECPSGCGPG